MIPQCFLYLGKINQMKNVLSMLAGTLFLLVLGCQSAQSQEQPITWTKDQLEAPAVLAQKITDGKPLPVIISVGPGAIIPHSLDAGMADKKEGIEKFEEIISKIPKDTDIVIYCGCCPFAKCPNVRPALAKLKEAGFTHYKLLNLPDNINKDWIAKGYPHD